MGMKITISKSNTNPNPNPKISCPVIKFFHPFDCCPVFCHQVAHMTTHLPKVKTGMVSGLGSTARTRILGH